MNMQSVNLVADLTKIMVDDEHPWPGLASFREQDAHFFKGRESDIETLHSLVNRERLSILFGISGLGKSSLLQAGLLPRLHQDNIFPVTIRLDFGETAISLCEQVFATIAQQVQEENIEAPLHREDETLWEYFHRKDAAFWGARNRIAIPLLCFDQFEEIFTLGREDHKKNAELQQFIIELAGLVEGRCPESVKTRIEANPDEAKDFTFSGHPYKLIFSLREDYLADLEGLRELIPSVLYNRMRLLPMSGKQALAVVNQTHGRLMEESVAQMIVRLVAGKQEADQNELSALGVEPALLSLICRELNEQRIANNATQINAKSVDSNREQILVDFYENTLDDQPLALRYFIEDKLVTVSGFRNSEAYDNALGIPGITAPALDRLVQCRLLRFEERDGSKRIELIHDVLTGVVSGQRNKRELLKQVKDRLEAPQVLKLFVYALFVGITFALIAQFDPWGLKTTADIQSESVFMRLIGGPWYQSESQDKITVILIDDQYLEETKDHWPMSYGHQAMFLENILDFNPKAVYLDIIYRHDHGDEETEVKQLRDVVMPSSGHNANRDPQFFLPYLTFSQSELSSCDPDDYQSASKFIDRDSVIQAMQVSGKGKVYIGWEGCGDRYPSFILGDSDYKTPAFALYQHLCLQSDFFSDNCADIRVGNLEQFKEPMAVQWGVSATETHQSLLKNTAEDDGDEYDGVTCSLVAKNKEQRVSFLDRVVFSANQAINMLGQSFDSGTERGELAPCTYIDTLHATWFNSDRQPALDKIFEKLIKDRIILVGTQLDGIHDNVTNPVNGIVPGVYLSAMALDNYLEFGADFYRPMSRTTAVLLEMVTLSVMIFLIGLAWQYVQLKSVIMKSNDLSFSVVAMKFSIVFFIKIIIPVTLSLLLVWVMWSYQYVPLNWIVISVLSFVAVPISLYDIVTKDNGFDSILKKTTAEPPINS